jgi:outer membrane protein assembly factor BamB
VIGSQAIEEDVVVTSVLADGSLQVVRAVGRTGVPVWTYRSEPGRLPPDGEAWAYVQGDVVLVDGGVTMAVSLETGLEVPVPEDAFEYDYDLGGEIAVTLAEGVEVRLTYEPTTGHAESGRVVAADGSTRFEFEGEPWGQGRSDGSAADVFVVRQDDTADDPGYEGLLLGLDLATGEQLWSVPDEYTQRLLQIDGLAVATGGTTSAIDVRTGRQLWERPVSGETAGVPLTDGDTVLLPERGEDGCGFAAVDLRTGVEEWWMPAPIGVIDARVADNGLVLLLTTTEIVAYR